MELCQIQHMCSIERPTFVGLSTTYLMQEGSGNNLVIVNLIWLLLFMFTGLYLLDRKTPSKPDFNLFILLALQERH